MHRLVASGGRHAAPCPITLPGRLLMLAPLGLALDAAARDDLRRRYDAARDAETRTRFQMVLLAGAGWPAVAVAALVRRSPDTVWRVVRRYQQGGPDGVPHRPRPGHRGRIPGAWAQELRRVIELDPNDVGVESRVWTTRLLDAYLAGGNGHREQ